MISNENSVKDRTRRRRGLAVAMVAVLSTVMIAFAAFAIDIGAMCVTKSELQRTADVAALAAAMKLPDYSSGDPKTLARHAATQIASENSVLKDSPILETSDIVFGRVVYNEQTGKFGFQPDNNHPFPDAVQVTVRRESGSPNGPMDLYFAGIFGKNTKDLRASATAMLVPRDIAIVADLSGSINVELRRASGNSPACGGVRMPPRSLFC